MDAKTTYLENALINHVLRNTALSSPTTVYIGLYTVAPTDAGGGTEVTGGSYARQSAAFSAPVSGATSNSGSVTFPAASAPWGTVVAMGIFDALSGGNLLFYGTLSVSKVVGTGDQIAFANGTLTVTEN